MSRKAYNFEDSSSSSEEEQNGLSFKRPVKSRHRRSLTETNPPTLITYRPPPEPPKTIVGADGQIGDLAQPVKDPSLEMPCSQIMDVMGFPQKKVLAQYLQEAKKPPPKFSMKEFQAKVDKLNICLADMQLITPEEINFNEQISWILSTDKTPLKLDKLLQERIVGPKITEIVIDKRNAFIDHWLFKELVDCKGLFDNMGHAQYQTARAKANILERVNKGPFMSRASIKMMNLDIILDHALTNPKTPAGVSVVGPNELFYFADVCAGPGGFSEYILWTKGWQAKGFGMTLKGDSDFDLDKFKSGTESFETFYGPGQDGDIYNPLNACGFIQHVLYNTENKGVHLMMADGGFSFENQEQLQESLSYQIILSQVFVALGAVRVGGVFVCKLFDTVTPFSVAVVFLAHQCFEYVGLHKPLTSRPANSERYMICKGKKSKEFTVPIASYLADCHKFMWENKNKESTTILELVPVAILASGSDPFYLFMRSMNNRLASKQIDALKRTVAYIRDTQLDNYTNQSIVRQQAIKYWKIPQEIPPPVLLKSCHKLCTEILQELPLTMLGHSEKHVFIGNVESLFKSAYDWRFVPVSGHSNNRGFYMSLGRTSIYRYDGSRSMWTKVTEIPMKLELPAKTLVYGEFVREIHGRGITGQFQGDAFNIIDALSLGGVDLRRVHYTERMEACGRFAKAVTRPNCFPVRATSPIRMENLDGFIEKLENRLVKGAGKGGQIVCPLSMDSTESCPPCIIPTGILFLKITRDPWEMRLNKTNNRKSFYNTVTDVTLDHIPQTAVSGFFYTMANRVLWTWDRDTNVVLRNVEPDDPRMSLLHPDKLHACNLLNHVNYTIHSALKQKTDVRETHQK